MSSSCQPQQPVAMVISDDDDDDDDNDDDAPPDYDGTAYSTDERRLSMLRGEMTGAGTSRSTLSSEEATRLSFVGSVPAPPAYQPYSMATDDTGTCIAQLDLLCASSSC